MYPAEILWEMSGDCEDHAILYATIMEGMGYDTVLFLVYCHNSDGSITGHMATGVSVTDGSGSYVINRGKAYFYCETTAIVGSNVMNEANVGYKPSNYQVMEVYYETEMPSWGGGGFPFPWIG